MGLAYLCLLMHRMMPKSHKSILAPVTYLHALRGLYRILEQDKYTVVIQRKKPVKGITAEKVVHTLQTAGGSSIPQYSGLVANIQNKDVEETPSLFEGFLDHHYINDVGHLQFLLSGSRNYEATWESRNNMVEGAISRYFARMRRAVPDKY